MINDGRRYIETPPTRKPATQTEIGVVAVSKEMLVEEADHFEHLAAI